MRRIAVLVLVLLTGQAILPATCIGWESDPAARKACCQRARHTHCQDQTAADDCCATHEAASNGTVAVSLTNAVTTPGVSLAAAPSFELVPSLDSRSHLRAYLARPHDPPHLNSPPLRR